MPERLVVAVDHLDVQPADQILEIGCGRGVAAALICRRLEGGRLVALDRSAKAIAAATLRNAEAIAAGKVQFAIAALEDANPAAPDIYDKVLAVNVNLFWVRPAQGELQLIARLLKPGGRLLLCYDLPDTARLAQLETTLFDHLERAGYRCTATTLATAGPTLLSVTARPGAAPNSRWDVGSLGRRKEAAMTLSWPNHLLTLEEWEALPEDSAMRLELAEGVLVMSPMPFAWHQMAGMRLTSGLDQQLPRMLTALAEVEIVIAGDPLTIRVPDVMVTRTELYETNPPRCAAADVHLAVEVLSDGTRRVDRVLKFSEYADAGIRQYWIVDLGEPTTLTAYVLIDGNYELSGEHTGNVTLDVAGHSVTLDLGSLTRR